LITDEDETAHITGWVGLGYFREKNRFKPVWFGFARFFSGLARIFSVWVRFNFFGFRLIKLKPNRSVF